MNSKRLLLSLSIVLSFAAVLALVPAGAQTARKPRVAIMDFDYATVQTSSAALFGTNVDVGKGITNLLITDLVKDGTYSVIERQALDKLMTEQNFSNSNRADPTSAAKLGKLLGVDAIIIGAITEFGSETQKRNIGGAGGNWGGFGVGGIGHSNSKANVGINARIINVETGEILGVAEGVGQSSRSSTSLLGGGGNWHGFGAGAADFGSSNFQQTIIGEATKTATDKLVADLASSSTKIPITVAKVDGLVAAVDGGQIVLNVGSGAGVKVGDLLEVVRVTKEIKDPATGEVIRRLSTTVGTIKATDVDAKSSVCTAVSGSDFKEGDRVRTPQ